MLASFSGYRPLRHLLSWRAGPLPNSQFMVRSANGGKRREEPLITPISVMHRRSFSVAIWGAGGLQILRNTEYAAL